MEGSKFSYGVGCLFELGKGLIVLFILVVLTHFFIATIFIVDGISMEPNFHTGQAVVVNELSYLIKNPQRGDAVILRFPGDPDHKKYIKRIIGLPGEKVEIKDNAIYINNKKLYESYIPSNYLTEPNQFKNPTTLGLDEYYIVGDNRENSNDSRVWGPAQKRFLIGSASFILWPFSSFGLIEKPAY